MASFLLFGITSIVTKTMHVSNHSDKLSKWWKSLDIPICRYTCRCY